MIYDRRRGFNYLGHLNTSSKQRPTVNGTVLGSITTRLNEFYNPALARHHRHSIISWIRAEKENDVTL